MLDWRYCLWFCFVAVWYNTREVFWFVYVLVFWVVDVDLVVWCFGFSGILGFVGLDFVAFFCLCGLKLWLVVCGFSWWFGCSVLLFVIC